MFASFPKYLHVGFVLTTVVIIVITGFLPFWVPLILLVPMGVLIQQRTKRYAAIVTARALVPISAGLLMMCFYDALPMMLGAEGNFMTKENFGHVEAGTASVEFSAESFYLEAISVLYAMFAAFLLFKGLEDFDELHGALAEEAAYLSSLEKYSEFILHSEKGDDLEATREVRCLLREYVERAIKHVRSGPTQKNEDLLSRCVSLIVRIDPDTDMISNAQGAMMEGLDNLTRARARRALAMRNRLPPLVMTFVLLMSGSLILPFFGAPSEDFSTNHVYIFLMTSCFTFVYMLLLDLNSPFEGYWQVSMDAFERVRDRLGDNDP